MNEELRQSLHWIEDQLRDIHTVLLSIVDRLQHTGILAAMNTPRPAPQDENGPSFENATQRFHARIARMADLAKMRMPVTWPKRPFLCLRHTALWEDGLPKLGLLYEHEEGKVEPVVYGVNLYDIGDTIKSEEQFLAKAYKRYGSFEELSQDGWIVD